MTLRVVLLMVAVSVSAGCPSLKPGTDTADAEVPDDFDSGSPPIDAGEPGDADVEDTGPRDAEVEDTGPDAAMPTPVDPGDLVISEIMIRPNDSEPHWIEIQNTTSDRLDVDTCKVVIGDGSGAVVAMLMPGDPLPGRAYGVISEGALTGSMGPVYYSADLALVPDTLISLICREMEIDRVDYRQIEFPDPHPYATSITYAQTIQLDVTKMTPSENDDGHAWCNSEAVEGTATLYGGTNTYGSPAAENKACAVPTVPNTAGQVIFTEFFPNSRSSDSNQQWLEVRSAGQVNSYSLQGCVIEGRLGTTPVTGMDTSVWIRPGRYAVFGQSDPSIDSFVDYDLMSLVLCNPHNAAPPCSNAEDVRLKCCGGTPIQTCSVTPDQIDAVNYYYTGFGGDFPFTSDDGVGVNLNSSYENDFDNNYPSNWCSSTFGGFTYEDPDDTENDNYGSPGATCSCM